MSKNYCALCEYNPQWDRDRCKKLIDTRRFNLYNGQCISGETFYVQKRSNFEGKCKYYKHYKSKKKWYEFWK